MLTLCALIAVPGLSFASELHGVNRRPPAPTRTRVKVNRYRTAAKPVDIDPNCNCNPGIYSVIYLTGDELPPVKPSSDTAAMAQKEMKFEPAVIAVGVGSTVEFPNLDPFFHNVFSYSKTKKFDLGRYPQGNTEVVTFDKPGIVKVFCEIHASMRAYVHVLDTPLFAVSDERGAFHISSVPPGEYTLHVWQENLSDYVSRITVDADSTYIEIHP